MQPTGGADTLRLGSQSASRGNYFLIIVVGVALLAALAVLVAVFGKPLDTASIPAAAGVLALVPAVAIGIERGLEGFWTLVDRVSTQPNWPFKEEADIVSQFASSLSTYVKVPLDQTNSFLANASTTGDKVDEALAAAQPQIQGLLKDVNTLLGGQDPKEWPNLQVLKGAVQGVQAVVANPDTKAALTSGVTALDDMSGWVNTLVTNPGRKLLSLFAGSLLGLGVAWLLGLDLVHAALGVRVSGAWYWGTVATGIAIGLGSSPTHEIIKAIQAYKQQTQ